MQVKVRNEHVDLAMSQGNHSLCRIGSLDHRVSALPQIFRDNGTLKGITLDEEYCFKCLSLGH